LTTGNFTFNFVPEKYFYHKLKTMRTLLSLLLVCTFFSFVAADNPLTEKERKFAADLLKDTHTTLEKSVEGLSDAQLNFKATDSTWSVDGCVKHIATTEKAFLGAIEAALKNPPNPEKRAEIKVTDEQLVGFLENRSTKVKTSEQMKPENSPFKTTAEALSSIRETRKKLIDFVTTTQEDLRNHVIQLPFGVFDSYQVVLIIGSHCNRHTQQLEEVKANAAFPKN
jgi:uncharacterized damage-inducible protein DinB